MARKLKGKPRKAVEMLKLAYLKVKEWGLVILLGLGAVVGYFAFIKKQDLDLKERPEALKIDMPKRPKEKDHKKTLQEKLDDIRKDRSTLKNRHKTLKLLNDNAKERMKK